MASSRTPQNIFWSTITSLVDTELVTMELLYNQALHRLHDSAYYALGKVAEVYQRFASQDVGTAAYITGSVDLTVFNFDAGIALSGLTVTFDEDTTTPQTVTFPNTITSIPLLIAELYAQAATNLDFEITSDGKLRAKSGTLGVSSTMATIAGTAAVALFGTQTSVAGSGAVADGSVLVGVGAVGSFAGGTLRALLEIVVPAVDGIVDRVAKAGDTMTGDLTMDATSEIKLADRTVTRHPRTPWTITYSGTPEWLHLTNGHPAQQLAFTGSQVITRDIDALTNDVITGFSVSCKFDGVHASYPPGQFPRVRLLELRDDGVTIIVSTVVDAPASQLDYQSVHTISASGLSTTVVPGRQYRLEIRGENAQGGFQVYGSEIEVTTKGLPPGG